MKPLSGWRLWVITHYGSLARIAEILHYSVEQIEQWFGGKQHLLNYERKQIEACIDLAPQLMPEFGNGECSKQGRRGSRPASNSCQTCKDARLRKLRQPSDWVRGLPDMVLGKGVTMATVESCQKLLDELKAGLAELEQRMTQDQPSVRLMERLINGVEELEVQEVSRRLNTPIVKMCIYCGKRPVTKPTESCVDCTF